MRALQVVVYRGHKRIEDRHLLLALSQAELGVIPRVLHTLKSPRATSTPPGVDPVTGPSQVG